MKFNLVFFILANSVIIAKAQSGQFELAKKNFAMSTAPSDLGKHVGGYEGQCVFTDDSSRAMGMFLGYFQMPDGTRQYYGGNLTDYFPPSDTQSPRLWSDAQGNILGKHNRALAMESARAGFSGNSYVTSCNYPGQYQVTTEWKENEQGLILHSIHDGRDFMYCYLYKKLANCSDVPAVYHPPQGCSLISSGINRS